MQEEVSNYQLRRMVLVNAGTNKHVPSNRITEIDPRGGAAVLGDNGVGKTTTLRILPLFFGHLPSQIVSSGQGQDPMVQFILPTTASAIAFEYQRGSDKEEDLRLAVIRRRAEDPNVPFYRLYKCGFRKELFIEDNRFLDDEETQLKASSLGIVSTPKLSTSDYRAVILRTPATSKEKEKLRRYSLEWSYGPKALDNLDRLVAAMVKKHINFVDIVQVAVGLVQQDLGHGSDKAKLSFRLGKASIERWLNNRNAVADAFKLKPKISELEDSLRALHTQETKFRALRADVLHLLRLRKEQIAKSRDEVDELMRRRHEEQAQQQETHEQLRQQTAASSELAKQSKDAYEAQASKASHFEKHEVSTWELKLQELPDWQHQRDGLTAQIAAATSQNTDVKNQYQQLQSEAQQRASTRMLELEQQKQPHRVRLEQQIRQSDAAESTEKVQIDAEWEEKKQALEAQKEPLIEQRGRWLEQTKHPQASPEALSKIEQLSEKATTCAHELQSIRDKVFAAKDALSNAQAEFTKQENLIQTAKTTWEQAKQDTERARQCHAPVAGSLLAVLRGSHSQGWRHNLAKVIHPAILERKDIDPVLLEEASTTLYGWQVNLGVLPVPEWADDEQARQALELAEERQTTAKAQWEYEKQTLEIKSNTLKDAKEAFRGVEAEQTLCMQRQEKLGAEIETAKQKIALEKQNAAAKARTEILKLESQLEDIQTQKLRLAKEHDNAQRRLKQSHQEARELARKACDAALLALDASIDHVRSDMQRELMSLDAQLKAKLAESGVDVESLNDLDKRRKECLERIHELIDKQPLVEAWKAWLEQVGPIKLNELREKARQTKERAEADSNILSAFEKLMREQDDAHNKKLSKLDEKHTSLAREASLLTQLIEDFGDYQAIGYSTVTDEMTVKELQGQVSESRNTLSQTKASISKQANAIRQSLTARESQVKELISTSLEAVANSDDIHRAEELCTSFKLIGPQVATDVNLTLKTLLTHIGSFQKSIYAFEKEVEKFNQRLQAGLNEVRRFERIKDLRLDIITNFENLGFYKKLNRMNEIVRFHNSEMGKDYSSELPPDETARALTEFMSVLGNDGNVEVNLSAHITLKGSVTDNGQTKEFKRASELENISSEGLTSLILITLMTALLNTIRGAEPVFVPWVTDEVGKFDPKNFLSLMLMLQGNRIDVVTASPELGPAQQGVFARRYLFEDKGRIRVYSQPNSGMSHNVVVETAA